MAIIDTDAPLRARFSFAKKLRDLLTRISSNHAMPKTLTDAQARDIGLSRNDLERLRFEWPSASSDRPLL